MSDVEFTDNQAHQLMTLLIDYWEACGKDWLGNRPTEVTMDEIVTDLLNSSGDSFARSTRNALMERYLTVTGLSLS